MGNKARSVPPCPRDVGSCSPLEGGVVLTSIPLSGAEWANRTRKPEARRPIAWWPTTITESSRNIFPPSLWTTTSRSPTLVVPGRLPFRRGTVFVLCGREAGRSLPFEWAGRSGGRAWSTYAWKINQETCLARWPVIIRAFFAWGKPVLVRLA